MVHDTPEESDAAPHPVPTSWSGTLSGVYFSLSQSGDTSLLFMSLGTMSLDGQALRETNGDAVEIAVRLAARDSAHLRHIADDVDLAMAVIGGDAADTDTVTENRLHLDQAHALFGVNARALASSGLPENMMISRGLDLLSNALEKKMRAALPANHQSSLGISLPARPC